MGWTLADIIKSIRGTAGEVANNMRSPRGDYVLPPVVAAQPAQVQTSPPLAEQRPVQQLSPEEELLRQAQARRERILNMGYLPTQ